MDTHIKELFYSPNREDNILAVRLLLQDSNYDEVTEEIANEIFSKYGVDDEAARGKVIYMEGEAQEILERYFFTKAGPLELKKWEEI